MQSKPNVVFVLTDDQGYPPFGCHGHPFIKTPNLDAFHERSVHMEQFHVGPTCAPTRAGLLTGHYSNSTGVWHTIGGRSLLRANEWTLADALREDGYRTALFGKWHLGDESPYVPHERGFETAIYHGGGGVSQSHDYWGNDYFDDTYWVNGTPKQFKGYCTDVFFGEALTYIEEHKDEPFFCYISTNAPHAPYNIDNAYYDLYKDKTDSEEYARFLGMITNIDENFGKLQAKLEELNIADNTILIFMSDNGQCGYAARGESNVYNCGMRGMKGSEYEGGHRAPFLLRYPNGGLDAERAIDDVTAFVDFMPTILDLCNVQVPQERTFHGRSIVPLLRGETDDEWRTRCVVTDSQRLVNPVKWKQSCVLRDTLRLVDRDELYDIATDPSQEHDIAADHPEIVEELRTAYEEWWTIVSQQFDDEIPISIGTPSRTEARLNAHDLRNEDMNIAWHQGHIRKGHASNGYWEVMVEQPGRYTFELRRWPREAGHDIRAGIDGDDVEFRRECITPESHSWYTGGTALDINTACLKITGQPMLSCPVNDNEDTAVFTVELPAGPTHVQTWFTDNKSLFLSAYYVSVSRMSE